MIMTNYRSPVRVTQYDTGPHVNKLIHKEEPALEHLLMNQHTAFSLGSHHQKYAQQVGRYPWPGRIRNGHDGTINKGFNFIIFLSRYINILTTNLQLYPHTLKRKRNNAQLGGRSVLDGEFTLRHGSHSNKAAYFNHVGQNAMCCAV